MKISSFEISLTKGITQHTDIEVTKYEPPPANKPKGRKYTPVDRVTYGPFLEELFYNNEIAAYDREAKTNTELKTIFLIDQKNNYILKNRFKRYKETIGNLRSKYNRRMLYSQQEPVYLISNPYDTFGYIVLNGKQYYTHISFQEVYRQCLDLKIADPRFIPPDLIEKLRDRKNSEDPQWQDWSVPPAKWIKSFERTIGMEAYNSVRFPQGYTREETPKDSDL